VIAMRLGAQLLDVFLACAEGRLAEARLNWAEDHALTVVMASRGYPGEYEVGEPIEVPPPDDPRVMVFHAGTAERDGRLVTSGGRVLSVTARAGTLAEARTLAYGTLKRIGWQGAHYRTDIGHRALTRPAA
jgi:phosphoribosylamine---glycine ligase